MIDIFHRYQAFLLWSALVVVIALRLLSMWAFDPQVAAKFPLIRFFNPNNWVVFRFLSFQAAFILAVVGFQTGSYGHSVSNGFYGFVALYPNIFRVTGRIFKGASDYKALVKVFGVPTILISCATYVVLSGQSETLRWGYALQAGGGFLLCAGFTAMMAQTWGPESAGTWSFLWLAAAWDLLLLLGVLALYIGGQPVLEFVVFEVVILTIELMRVFSKARADPLDAKDHQL